jgi:predicted phosphodiesterase
LIRRLFIPDCHFPTVDYAAYGAMLAAAQDFKPHEIVILGDFFDMYPVSQYAKNPERMVVALEEDLVSGIDALRKMFLILRPQKIWFLLGNHEHRLSRYLQESAPIVKALFPSFHELFELPKNCEVIPYGKFLEFEDLCVCHGIVCGNYCAYKMLAKLRKNVLFGHTHKLQMACQTTMDGVIRAYSCGWLGEMDSIDYSNFPEYQHGFATGHFSKSGKWDVQLHAIQGDQLVANGRHYKRKILPTSR